MSVRHKTALVLVRLVFGSILHGHFEEDKLSMSSLGRQKADEASLIKSTRVFPLFGLLFGGPFAELWWNRKGYSCFELIPIIDKYVLNLCPRVEMCRAVLA